MKEVLPKACLACIMHNDVDNLKRMKLDVRCYGNVALRELSSSSLRTEASMFCFLFSK